MPTMRNGDGYGGGSHRRSSEWFDRRDLDGFLHRSWLKSTGVTNETFRGRPVIGICNSWSELVNCNVHLRGLALDRLREPAEVDVAVDELAPAVADADHGPPAEGLIRDAGRLQPGAVQEAVEVAPVEPLAA